LVESAEETNESEELILMTYTSDLLEYRNQRLIDAFAPLYRY